MGWQTKGEAELTELIALFLNTDLKGRNKEEERKIRRLPIASDAK